MKERIIRPWIESKSLELIPSEIKSDPLYKDLKNHIPSNLENPISIAENIEKDEKRLRKLDEEVVKKLKNTLIEILREKGLKIGKIYENETGWSLRI